MSEAQASRVDAGTGVLSIKVTLRDIEPAIWRRIVMPRSMTLGRLHDAIQAASGECGAGGGVREEWPPGVDDGLRSGPSG